MPSSDRTTDRGGVLLIIIYRLYPKYLAVSHTFLLKEVKLNSFSGDFIPQTLEYWCCKDIIVSKELPNGECILIGFITKDEI